MRFGPTSGGGVTPAMHSPVAAGAGGARPYPEAPPVDCSHCDGNDCAHHCGACGSALETVTHEGWGAEPGDCIVEEFDACPSCEPQHFAPEPMPREPEPFTEEDIPW